MAADAALFRVPFSSIDSDATITQAARTNVDVIGREINDENEFFGRNALCRSFSGVRASQTA